jgi:hypothetical protein
MVIWRSLAIWAPRCSRVHLIFRRDLAVLTIVMMIVVHDENEERTVFCHNVCPKIDSIFVRSWCRNIQGDNFYDISDCSATFSFWSQRRHVTSRLREHSATGTGWVHIYLALYLAASHLLLLVHQITFFLDQADTEKQLVPSVCSCESFIKLFFLW